MTSRSLVCILLVLLAAAPSSVGAQSFTRFLSRVMTAPPVARQAIADSFATAVPVSPVIDAETLAVFYYKGPATSVHVPGDANAWNGRAFRMTRIPGTDLHFYRLGLEPDARLDYKLVVDDSVWMLDPRNPATSMSGFGPNSELRMPRVADHPEIRERPGVARGVVVDTVVSSTAFPRPRTVRIYLPPVPSTDSAALIIVHDGPEFISICGMPTILDNLLADGRIPPSVAVFIPPVDRSSEYAGDRMEAYVAFLADDVVPSIVRRYRLSHDPSRRVVMGASNGGNISLTMGLRRPHQFGGVVAFSSNVVRSLFDGFLSSPRLPLSLYLDMGTYDIPQLVPLVRSFVPVLREKGYRHVYHEFHEGHSWANWRSHIDDALEFVFARP